MINTKVLISLALATALTAATMIGCSKKNEDGEKTTTVPSGTVTSAVTEITTEEETVTVHKTESEPEETDEPGVIDFSKILEQDERQKTVTQSDTPQSSPNSVEKTASKKSVSASATSTTSVTTSAKTTANRTSPPKEASETEETHLLTVITDDANSGWGILT